MPTDHPRRKLRRISAQFTNEELSALDAAADCTGLRVEHFVRIAALMRAQQVVRAVIEQTSLGGNDNNQESTHVQDQGDVGAAAEAKAAEPGAGQ